MAFIKITTECFSSGVRLHPGLFYEVPRDEARTLISMGRAVEATAEEVQAATDAALREAEAEAKAEADAAVAAKAKADEQAAANAKEAAQADAEAKPPKGK